MRGANDGKLPKLIFNSRWIPEKSDSGQAYFSLRAVVHPDVTLGADYRPLSEDVGLLATWRVFSETDKWPALVVGTSHDDFTDGDEEVDSQTLYGSLSKYLGDLGPVEVAPYIGGAYIFELDDLRLLGGINLRYKDWSLLAQYSGTDTHLTAGWDFDSIRISAVYWGLKYPGLAATWRY